MQADAPGGHGHAIQHPGTGKNGQRIGGWIVLLIGFQDFIQILIGYRILQTFFCQIVVPQDQTAVIKRKVIQGRQIITFAILQVQHIHIFLQAKLLHSFIEIRCPPGMVADGYNGAVQCQRRIFSGGAGIQDYIRCVGSCVQSQGNLGGVIRDRNNLPFDIHVVLFFNGLNGKPVFLERQSRIVRIIHGYFDWLFRFPIILL